MVSSVVDQSTHLLVSGTPATIAQQAKDVTTYLRWCGEQWHDQRKRYAISVCII
jgi:cytochrome c1